MQCIVLLKMYFVNLTHTRKTHTWRLLFTHQTSLTPPHCIVGSVLGTENELPCVFFAWGLYLVFKHKWSSWLYLYEVYQCSWLHLYLEHSFVFHYQTKLYLHYWFWQLHPTLSYGTNELDILDPHAFYCKKNIPYLTMMYHNTYSSMHVLAMMLCNVVHCSLC